METGTLTKLSYTPTWTQFIRFAACDASAESKDLNWLDVNSRPIGQDFRDPIHDLIRVIAHTYDRIGAALGRMFAHMIEGFLPGRFGEMDRALSAWESPER